MVRSPPAEDLSDVAALILEELGNTHGQTTKVSGALDEVSSCLLYTSDAADE